MTEYVERVLDYQKIIDGKFIVRLKDDAGLGDEDKRVNTMPLQMGAFLLAISRRTMKDFIHAINGFFYK